MRDKENILISAINYVRRHPGTKLGVAVMDTAHNMFPGTTHLLRNSSLDCSRDNSKVEAFLNKLEELVG